jgi:hypothetical protein
MTTCFVPFPRPKQLEVATINADARIWRQRGLQSDLSRAETRNGLEEKRPASGSRWLLLALGMAPCAAIAAWIVWPLVLWPARDRLEWPATAGRLDAHRRGPGSADRGEAGRGRGTQAPQGLTPERFSAQPATTSRTAPCPAARCTSAARSRPRGDRARCRSCAPPRCPCAPPRGCASRRADRPGGRRRPARGRVRQDPALEQVGHAALSRRVATPPSRDANRRTFGDAPARRGRSAYAVRPSHAYRSPP